MTVVALLLPLVLGQAAPASQTSETKSLKAALTEMSRKADVYAVAVRSLEGLSVSPPPIDGVTKENIEAHLLAMVKKLSTPARLIRLNLPKSERQWTADELLTYARAEATLFKKTIGDIKPDSIEVLGQAVPLERAKSVMEAANLRPVYIVVMAQAQFGGKWETTYGTMELTQKGNRVTGSYSTNKGQITGDIVGNELRFIWFEQANGSGGRGVFVLAEDGMSFAGPWYTHENPEASAGVWSGKRSGN